MGKEMGEFQKQILKFNEWGGWGLKDYSLSAHDVFGILDKAKKEFEENLSPKYHPEPTENRILKWFEEWFINGKKE